MSLLVPDIQDVLVFGGLGIATYGIFLVSVPLSLVFCGLFLIYLGIR